MVDLCPKQVNDLRNDIKDRYGLEIDGVITRVEFEEQGRNRVYFRAEDSYKPNKAAAKQEEKPKNEYKLYVYDSEDTPPRIMQFGALDAAMFAYAAMQRLSKSKLVLEENGTVIQKYEE